MRSPYFKLAVMLSLNTVIMFLLTYTLIDRSEHFYPNINRVYMAVIMVSAMAAPMILIMQSMYPDRRSNFAIAGISIAVFVGAVFLAREQAFVGNEQFLRSMIPHHSSAILMCEHSSITDPDIISLCREIVDAQEREIAEMKQILDRYWAGWQRARGAALVASSLH